MNDGVRPVAPFGRRAARVERAAAVGSYNVLCALDTAGPRPRAGQFYMLQTPHGWGGGEDGRPYLPRPLSFARAGAANGGWALEFLLEDVGPGTHRLAALRPGDELLIAGPFGNGFAPQADRRALLVAGGVGLAPIVALADELGDFGAAGAQAFVGMRRAAHTAAIEHFGLACELATEDGSAGREGLVTVLLEAALAGGDGVPEVFACGPPAMLEAVRALCARDGVACQLALEAPMACGYGACHGCVVPTREGYVRLCVEGPVLRGEQLETAVAEAVEAG